MSDQDEIGAFLQDFHVKMKIRGIIFRDDRGKNVQTLLDLEITKDHRNQVIKELKVEDYSEGPLPEKLYGGADMWVFGKQVKKKEIYIKNNDGNSGGSNNMHFISYCRTSDKISLQIVEGNDFRIDA